MTPRHDFGHSWDLIRSRTSANAWCWGKDHACRGEHLTEHLYRCRLCWTERMTYGCPGETPVEPHRSGGVVLYDCQKERDKITDVVMNS
jgi:hypothetical protein